MSTDKKEKKGVDIPAELYFWAQALVFALVVLITINVFFFRLSGVRGGSMLNTLRENDQIIIRVIGYNEPEYGDIVVIKCDNIPNEPLVKRVIGKPGDVIDFNITSGTLYLNGVEQYEPYIRETMREFGNTVYPFTVPEGHVFVMGDNRNESTDSRELFVGSLPITNIVGKVVLRIWPINVLESF